MGIDPALPIDGSFWDLVEHELDAGSVYASEHPELPLTLYCYTRMAQFGLRWNAATTHCRGLVVDADRTVVARALPKFHNLKDLPHEERPHGDFVVLEKVDGSMVSAFRYDGQLVTTTKGGFSSEQATAGRALLESRYDASVIDADHTFVFEFIHPGNRIVVDYGDTIELVLLAVRHTATGAEVDYDTIAQLAAAIGCRPAARYDLQDADPDALRHLGWDNAEGFVLLYRDGSRVKVKFDEYVRLHALRTVVPTARAVWEAMRRGVSLDEMVDDMPDEFDAWVRQQAATMTDGIDELVVAVHEAYAALGLDSGQPRGQVAAKVFGPPLAGLVGREQAKRYAGLLMAIYDRGELRIDERDPREALPVAESKSLWNAVKPPANVYPPGMDLTEGIDAAA